MYVTYSLTHATAEATASHTPAPCRLSPADTHGDSLELHNSSMIPTHLMLRSCLSISTIDNVINIYTIVYVIIFISGKYLTHPAPDTGPPPSVLHRMHEEVVATQLHNIRSEFKT